MIANFSCVRTVYKTQSLFCYSVRCFSVSKSFRNIVKSPAPFLDIPKGNLVETIFKDVDKRWTKTALECPETGLKFTYSEVVDQISRWSSYLKQIGVTKGDVIGMVAPNTIQFPAIYFGIAAIGAALSPINSLYTPDEIERMLKINKAKIIIYSSDVESKLLQALKGRTEDYKLFSLGKSTEVKAQNVDDILYDDKVLQPSDHVEIDGSEIMYIPFSSGTTGLPKAVALSHNAFIANVHQCANPYHQAILDPTGSFQEIQMAIFPFSHIYGCFSTLVMGFFAGSKIIIPKFNPKFFIDDIIKYKITDLQIVPSLLSLLNNSPGCNPQTMANVRTVRCGAAPVLPSSVDMFRKKAGKHIDFLQGFGMSELLLAMNTPRRIQYPIGCGSLFSNMEAKIIHTESGEILGKNETGELCIKTPAVMQGYLHNSEETQKILIDDWIHTGDICYYDDDEFFHIVDRTKDLIKVQGLQVSPTEIEDELQKHPSVAECSVIGIPDEKKGEVPVAFVILKDEATEKELQLFIEKKLAKHKFLHGGVRFVDVLPKSQTGKVLRKILRTWI